MTMHWIRIMGFLCAGFALAPAWAGNWTLLAEFDGTESEMAISPASEFCFNPPEKLAYKDLGVIRVSQAGNYQASDVSPQSEGFPAVGSLESVLLLYQGPFDPQNPEMNRIAVFDYVTTDFVALDSGVDYRVVIQAGCKSEPGLAGFVLRGPGEFSGVGAPTPEEFYGDFSTVTAIADFPDWGTHKYVSFTFTPPRNGYYWIHDIGYGWDGTRLDHRLYDGGFDPDRPEDNLIVAAQNHGFKVYLRAGREIEVVNIDRYDADSIFQMAIHPPGELKGFNPAFTGTFADPAVPKQGMLMETDEVLNLVFLALFVFDDDASAQPMETAVGSSDQRWLTAFGGFSYDSNVVDLSFENTSGGRFNHPQPEAQQNSSYGTGTLTALDCDHLLLEYRLPGTPDGSMNLVRLLEGKGRICADWVWVGSPLDFNAP